MKRITIADAMAMTQSLARHVDNKSHKTADIFTMMKQMMEIQNNRIRKLEDKVKTLEAWVRVYGGGLK